MRKIVAVAFFSCADVHATDSLGEVTSRMTLPLSMFDTAIGKICLTLGIALLFSAFMQYVNRKKNPGQISLDSIVTLLVLGVGCTVLPILEYYLAASI